MKNNHIAENIKALRMHYGMSQEMLAEALGVNRNNIASYERGTEPRLGFINEFVNFFNISYHDLIYTRLTDKSIGKTKSDINTTPVNAVGQGGVKTSKRKVRKISPPGPQTEGTSLAGFAKVPVRFVHARAQNTGEEIFMMLPVQFFPEEKYCCFAYGGAGTDEEIRYEIARFTGDWNTLEGQTTGELTVTAGADIYPYVVSVNKNNNGMTLSAGTRPGSGVRRHFTVRAKTIEVWETVWRLDKAAQSPVKALSDKVEALEKRMEEIRAVVKPVKP